MSSPDDIREKAERLAAEMVDFLNANAVVFFSTEDGDQIAKTLAIPYISQALLEAHKAGREEMREEAAKNLLAQAEHYRKEGAWGDFAPICDHAASAIRSLPGKADTWGNGSP